MGQNSNNYPADYSPDFDNVFGQELEMAEEFYQWKEEQEIKQKNEMAYRRIMNELDYNISSDFIEFLRKIVEEG